MDADRSPDAALDAAVACIRAGAPGKRSRGTGTLVAPDLVLTALHVVADRFQDPPAFAPEGTLELRFEKRGVTTTATVVPGCFDPDEDWVLLRCSPPPGIRPAPLGTLAAHERGEDARFRSFGFPNENKAEGLPYFGYLADLDTRYAGTGDGPRPPRPARAVLLHAPLARGDDLRGLSGGPCFVGGALVGVIRSTLLDADELSNGRVYACPIDLILAKAGTHLPVPDPYRGLPGLPHRPLPADPFRTLDRYTEADAEIFFGRKQELRALHDALTSDDTPPVVLFYGQTGVGKSSVLDAGLLPRLRAYHLPVYLRRDAKLGLLGTLLAELARRRGEGAATGEGARLWREVESALGVPLIVMLDQVEEAYTRPLGAGAAGAGEPGDAELAELAAFLAAVLADPATAPRGRLMLSFRKEWLAEVRGALRRRELSYTEQHLRRLTAEGIEDVARGLESTPRIRAKWNATVGPGLPEALRGDLLVDRGSPVAPTLQILMTRLFAAASAASPGAPELTVELYGRVREGGLLLRDFLARQMQAVEEARPAHVASGLADDVLEAHVTPIDTAAEQEAAELSARYGHVEGIGTLVEALKREKLLVDAPGEGDRTRLAHDTLGPLVRERFRRSALPGQRARRILEARAEEWKAGAVGRPLDTGDLALVARGREGMRALTEDEERLWSASEEAERQRVEAERASAEAERERARELEDKRLAAERAGRNFRVGAGVGVLLLAGAVLMVLSQARGREAERAARERAERLAEIEQLLVRAEKATSPTEALPLLCRAVELAPDDYPRLDRVVARTVQVAVEAPVLSVSLPATVATTSGFPDLRRLTAVDLRADGAGAVLQLSDGALFLVPIDPAATDASRLLGAARPLPAGTTKAKAPRISPDGRWVAALHEGGPTLAIWDTGRAEPPREIDLGPTPTAQRVVWSDDGRTLWGTSDIDLVFTVPPEALAVWDGTWRRPEGGAAAGSAPRPGAPAPGGPTTAHFEKPKQCLPLAPSPHTLRVTTAAGGWSADLTTTSCDVLPHVRAVDDAGQRALVGRLRGANRSAAEGLREPVLVVRSGDRDVALDEEKDPLVRTDHAHLSCALSTEPSAFARFLAPARGPAAGRLGATCATGDHRTFWFDGDRWPSLRPVDVRALRAHRPALEAGVVVGVTDAGQLQLLSARSGSRDAPAAPAAANATHAPESPKGPSRTADGRYLIHAEEAGAGKEAALVLQGAASRDVFPPVRLPTSAGQVLLRTLLATARSVEASSIRGGELRLWLHLDDDAFVFVATEGTTASASAGVRAAPRPPAPASSASPNDRIAHIPDPPRSTPLVFSSLPAEGPGAFCLARGRRPERGPDGHMTTDTDIPLLAYTSAVRNEGVRPTAPWAPVIVEDLTNGSALATFYSPGVRSVSFSPGCERLQVVGDDGIQRSWFVLRRWGGKKPGWVASLGALVLGHQLAKVPEGEAVQAVPALAGPERERLLGPIRAANGQGDPAADHVLRHWFGADGAGTQGR